MDIYTLPAIAQKEGVSLEELEVCKVKLAGTGNRFIPGNFQIVRIQEHVWVGLTKFEPLTVYRGVGDSESFPAESQ